MVHSDSLITRGDIQTTILSTTIGIGERGGQDDQTWCSNTCKLLMSFKKSHTADYTAVSPTTSCRVTAESHCFVSVYLCATMLIVVVVFIVI